MSEITAPMGGKILDVRVNVGDTVNENDEVIILEAMKMNNEIPSPVSGIIKEIRVKEGDTIDSEDIIAIIEEEPE